MKKLYNPEIRREACWLYEDLMMEAQFAPQTARGDSLRETLDDVADLLQALFRFSEDEMYFATITRKERIRS